MCWCLASDFGKQQIIDFAKIYAETGVSLSRAGVVLDAYDIYQSGGDFNVATVASLILGIKGLKSGKADDVKVVNNISQRKNLATDFLQKAGFT